MPEKEVFVVVSRVKEYIATTEMQMAGDFPDALSTKVLEVMKEAVARAKANGRKTVRPEDL